MHFFEPIISGMVNAVSMLTKSHITLFLFLVIGLQQLSWNFVAQLNEPSAVSMDYIGNLSPTDETDEGEDCGAKSVVQEMYMQKEDAAGGCILPLQANPIRGTHKEINCQMAVLDVQSPPPDEMH